LAFATGVALGTTIRNIIVKQSAVSISVILAEPQEDVNTVCQYQSRWLSVISKRPVLFLSAISRSQIDPLHLVASHDLTIQQLWEPLSDASVVSTRFIHPPRALPRKHFLRKCVVSRAFPHALNSRRSSMALPRKHFLRKCVVSRAFPQAPNSRLSSRALPRTHFLRKCVVSRAFPHAPNSRLSSRALPRTHFLRKCVVSRAFSNVSLGQVSQRRELERKAFDDHQNAYRLTAGWLSWTGQEHVAGT
jgi:hypothetical protein